MACRCAQARACGCKASATFRTRGAGDIQHCVCACAHCRCNDTKWAASAEPIAAWAPHARFSVEGMTCGGCASSVRAAVLAVDGVFGVTVDVAAGTLAVQVRLPHTAPRGRPCTAQP